METPFGERGRKEREMESKLLVSPRGKITLESCFWLIFLVVKHDIYVEKCINNECPA